MLGQRFWSKGHMTGLDTAAIGPVVRSFARIGVLGLTPTDRCPQTVRISTIFAESETVSTLRTLSL